MSDTIVWLPGEGRYGRVLRVGAYTSTVVIFTAQGEEIAEIENDDIVNLWEEETDDADEQ